MADHSSDSISLFAQVQTDSPKDRISQKTGSPDKFASDHWDKCLDIIRDNVSSQVFKTWFEPIRALSWENNLLTVMVPSQFFMEWIEEHYYDLLQETIFKVFGSDAKLQYQVVVEQSEDSLDKRTIKLKGFRYPPTSRQSAMLFTQQAEPEKEVPSFLNPRYTLDNFITGESNQFAASAAIAVSQNPGGTRFNPLFIYGDTGLGKTHLAQGIGNYILQNNNRQRVVYTNSERFTMEFVNAIQNNKTNEFVNFYRNVDTLIVDDIQFFAGKEKTQDNFFHTFNALHQAGKQLVLTSDVPPKELRDVDDRLISRFQWGLTVDIQAPDLEMRMAILQRKSEDESIELPMDIIEYIARNVTNSVRELEGTLISLIAKVTLDRRELDLQLAKDVVQGNSGKESRPLTIEDIKKLVAEYYKMPTELLESKTRKH
ncbi:MAG: chromosomal replication initiator protein DnaA, partial [Candidatus Kapaibacterium sp.]